MEIKKYITIKELAERYGVHPSFFRKRIKDGTLKAFRLGGVLVNTRGKDGVDREIMRGGTWRVDEAEVNKFFAGITSNNDRKDVSTADHRTTADLVEKIRPYKGGYIDNVPGAYEAIRAGILVDIKTASAVAGLSTYTIGEWVYLDLIDVFYTHQNGRRSYFVRTDCNVKKIESKARVVEAVPMDDDIRKQLEDGTVVEVDKLASLYVIKERNLKSLCKYGRLKNYYIQGTNSYLVDLNAFKAFALKRNIKLRSEELQGKSLTIK